ncbi:peptidase M15A [Phormidium tenue FACHB-886]|nr:peptidase M15A [Phormidium tenue FACHB-886]
MAGLSAAQRNFYYCNEAIRAGVHKPILAALHAAHRRPPLADGTQGLGVSPANRIALEQVNTFATQVQFAANTVRSVTDKLTAQGWKGSDIWNTDEGRYSDRFLQTIANGYIPPPSDLAAARLEVSDLQTLQSTYLEDWTLDCKAANLSPDQSFLDGALLQIAEQISRYYIGLSFQRDAFLEAVRIWRKLNTRQAAIASLLRLNEADPNLVNLDETPLDRPLVQFIQQLAPFYAGYPHQREALLRLIQLWRQLESREAAIASLQISASPETNIRVLDPALIVFAQRIPQQYQGKGEQRSAMTEAFRLWYDLDSRGAALQELGVDARVLTASNPDRNALINAAAQLDRALLDFIKRIPLLYEESDRQREALIRLAQLWRGLDGRDRTIQVLLDEVIRLEQIRRDAPDAPPSPEPVPLPPHPEQWTLENLQIHAPILINGSFTWAEATQGGLYLPSIPETLEAIIHLAGLAQQIQDRLNRPLRITKWYFPTMDEGVRSPLERLHQRQQRHFVGDAIEFYCDGLTGDQIYRAIDPWWTGGLGRYRNAAYLCYVDAREYRARWTL